MDARYRAFRRDACRDLEGGRVLHDLLPRRPAADPGEPCRSLRAGRRLALVFLPAHPVPAPDADHAVRDGQCRHQRQDLDCYTISLAALVIGRDGDRLDTCRRISRCFNP